MAISIVAVNQVIEPALAALGLDLLGTEFIAQGRNSILRIYIDKSDGVDIDDCQTASRQISHVLDVEDPIAGHYHLEVSTPGIERPLFKLAHYQAVLGETIKLKLTLPRDGRRNYVGKLQEVAETTLTLLVDEQLYHFPFAEVQKGRLVVDY